MKCPYCAEEIKDEAIICRYCHRDLTSVRLNTLESTIKKHFDELETNLYILTRRIDYLESALGVVKPLSQTATSAQRFAWPTYLAGLLIGSIIPIGSVYFYLVTYSSILLLLPFLVWTGVGIWPGLSDQNRSVKRYLLLGIGIGAINFFGLVATILNVVYGWETPQAIRGAILYNRDWGWTPLLLFATPFFLVILGGFIGEWLESRRPSGRELKYPRELAEQLIKLSTNKDKSSIDIENLTNILTALAPLIAAVGGIIVPIVTILLSR